VPAETLQGEREVLMGLCAVRIELQHLLILDHRRREVPAGTEDIGQLQASVAMLLVELDRGLEVQARALEVADAPKRRPKRRLPFGRLAGNGSRLAEQVARLCGSTELVAHHCEAAQRTQVGRLAFEKAPIDLFGGAQEIVTGRRARQSCGGPECKSLFVHE